MTFVDIKPLNSADPGESVPFNVSLRDPRFADVPDLSDLKASGKVSRLDGGYLAKGALSVSVRLECARCLKAFDYSLESEFSEEFSLKPEEDQFRAGKDRLDLDPMFRAVILTQLPKQPLHDPDCKGLCPECGKNLNEEPHEHPDDPAAPGPFDQLKKLR